MADYFKDLLAQVPHEDTSTTQDEVKAQDLGWFRKINLLTFGSQALFHDCPKSYSELPA